MDEIHEVWPKWETVELLGKGAFGAVYKARRVDSANTSYSAIKIIHIPQDGSEVKDLQRSGMDMDSIHLYYEELIKNLSHEIQIMESLKTAVNIVAIEDYQIVEHKEDVKWDIFIRMELLEDLGSFIEKTPLNKELIAKIGIDICNALRACEKVNIIHRDIKIDNVFYNGFDSFKLGDFGISKQLEKTQSALSKKGTNMYMAPEIFRGKGYDKTVDIYALGIMLYRLLNGGRFPFQPPANQVMTYADSQKAIEKRLSGEKMSLPAMADEELGRIILKACEFDPEKRYQSADEMYEELKNYSYDMNNFDPILRDLLIEVKTSDKSLKTYSLKKNKKKIAYLLAGVVLLVILGIGGIVIGKSLLSRNDEINDNDVYVISNGITEEDKTEEDVSAILVSDSENENDDLGLCKEYTDFDKLQISAQFPENWVVDTDGDSLWATYKSENVKKEISISMDYYWTAVSKDGQCSPLVNPTTELAENGATKEFCSALLEKYYNLYEQKGINFEDLLKESAIYDINGRKYYYLQFSTNDNEEVAYYFTVQDGAEIYYCMKIENDEFKEEDRLLFDSFMKSVKMNTDRIDYSKIKAEDYIENIYLLDKQMTKLPKLGISVTFPDCSIISNQDTTNVIAEYNGNSYFRQYGTDRLYKIAISCEDFSKYGKMQNWINESIAEGVVEYFQKKGHEIEQQEFTSVGGHQFFSIISYDQKYRYYSSMTMNKGSLLIISFSHENPMCDFSEQEKTMIKEFVANLKFDL